MTTYKHKNLEFYAQDGIIHISNSSPKFADAPQKELVLSEWFTRISEMAKSLYVHNLYEISADAAERDWYEDLVSLLKKAMACYKEALEQGDPTNARVRMEKLKDYYTSGPKYTPVPESKIIIPGEVNESATKPELVLPADV